MVSNSVIHTTLVISDVARRTMYLLSFCVCSSNFGWLCHMGCYDATDMVPAFDWPSYWCHFPMYGLFYVIYGDAFHDHCVIQCSSTLSNSMAHRSAFCLSTDRPAYLTCCAGSQSNLCHAMQQQHTEQLYGSPVSALSGFPLSACIAVSAVRAPNTY